MGEEVRELEEDGEDSPIDELLDRSFRLVGKKGKTEGDVPPLTLVRRESESLAEFLDDALGLFLLQISTERSREEGGLD